MKADILYPLFKQLHTAAVVKLASEIKALADDPSLNTPVLYEYIAPDEPGFDPANEFIRLEFDAMFEDR